MLLQLRRIFYVTPTNFIELLKGYREILEEKRRLNAAQSNKLKNGLTKIAAARSQVEKMSVETDIKRQEVSKNSREVDELIVKITAERKVADEKQIYIKEQTEIISREKQEALALAADAEADLKKYEPELIKAQEAIDSLDNKSIAEIKAYTQPPQAVMVVMSAVMTVFGREASWASAKKMMSEPGFLKVITNYPKDQTSQATVNKIAKYTKEEDFQYDILITKSTAAAALCLWVRAIEGYAKALKTVAPKRARMQYAMDQVAKKEATLKQLQDEYEVLAARLQELEILYNTKQSELEEYKAVLKDLETKIDRGERLVQGLAGEKLRWESTIDELDLKYENLVGDCILSAAFMSYCGPFPADYRGDLISNWMERVSQEKIPHSGDYKFNTFMASEAQARVW
jgi:dynein heavy chain